MNQLDGAGFARGVNDAIRAIRGIYGGVRTMLSELAGVLEQPPAPLLYDLGARPRSDSRRNPDEKILRSWEGRFFGDEPVEGEDSDYDEMEVADEADGETGPRRSTPLFLRAGQNLGFVKVVLYEPGVEGGEPHLLYGVLRNCRVRAGWPGLEARRNRLRRVLEVVKVGMKPGELTTMATVDFPRGETRKRGKDPTNRLLFTVDRPPERLALFDVKGPDQLLEIAGTLKRLWQG